MIGSAPGIKERTRSRAIIIPHPRRPLVNVRELWSYREVLHALVRREIKIRYAQTAAGAAWVILQPLLTTAVLTVLAGRWMKVPAQGVPYPLFAFAGLIPWTYFTHVLTKSGGSLISTGLLSKAYFPRLLLPLASAAGGLIDVLVAGAILAVLMIYYGAAPGWGLLLAPACMALVMLAAFGFGVWIAVTNLYFRDVMYALPFAMQIGFLITPAAYPISVVPERWRMLYSLNPLLAPIECWRWSILGITPHLSPYEWIASFSVGAAVLISGLWYFRRKEPVMADVGES